MKILDNLPLWLKYAIKFVFCYIIIVLIYFTPVFDFNFSTRNILFIPSIPGWFVTLMTFGDLTGLSTINSFLSLFITYFGSAILYFIIGAITGFLLNKGLSNSQVNLKQKSKITKIIDLIILLLLILFIIISIWIGNYIDKINTDYIDSFNQSKQDISISNYTYIDGQNNIELKYPINWDLTERETTNEATTELIPRIQENCGTNIVGNENKRVCLDSISIKVIENENKLTLAKFWEQKYGWKENINYKNLNNHYLGYNNFFRATLISAYDEHEDETFWVALKDGNFFTITSSYLNEEQIKIFNNIVSSFRFTK
jgi:hypothetical protein